MTDRAPQTPTAAASQFLTRAGLAITAHRARLVCECSASLLVDDTICRRCYRSATEQS